MMELLNPKLIQEWAGVLALACAGIGFLLSTKFVSKSELGTVTSAIDKLKESFDTREDAIEARVARLEGMAENLPTKEALHEVKVQLTKQEGQISALRESATGTRNAVERIETYLLEGKARR